MLLVLNISFVYYDLKKMCWEPVEYKTDGDGLVQSRVGVLKEHKGYLILEDLKSPGSRRLG